MTDNLQNLSQKRRNPPLNPLRSLTPAPLAAESVGRGGREVGMPAKNHPNEQGMAPLRAWQRGPIQ